MIKKRILVAGAALLLQCGTALQAAVIPNVSIAGASSFYSNGTTDQRTPTNLVNGSGLFGFAQTPNVTGSGWLTLDNSAVNAGWVVFDLGAVHTLSSLKVYNYDEGIPTATGISNGVKTADILFGTTAGAFDSTMSAVAFNIAPGGSTTTQNVRDFSQTINAGGVSARYVAISNVTANWGGGLTASNINKIGLSKVLFIDTNVPATATLATENFTSNAVTVWFSEPVTSATATNIANYVLTTTGTDTPAVATATVGAFGDNVTLTTASTLTDAFSNYSLKVSGVAAASDNTLISNTVPVQTALAFWLKADAGITLSGTTVAAWADQSGNGNNAVQATNATQPTFVASDIGGMPTVKFSSAHYLEVPFSPTMGVMRDYSVVAVVKMNATPSGSNGEIVSRAAVNRAAPFDYRVQTASVIMYRGNQGGGSSADNVVSTVTLSNGAPSLIACVLTGTNCTHYLNGLLNGSGQELTGFLDNQSVTRVGSRVDNGATLNGNISEIMLFRGAISASDRIALNGYLGSKYGLTIVDLSFTSVPTNTSVVQGRTATFTGAAVASSTNAISYQWQTNGVNIAGATKTTYTTPIQQLTNSGTQYTLVATSGTSVITSAPPATLTVTVDSVAPTISYAGEQFWNRSNIVVVYSESIDQVTGLTPANYSLTDISSAPVSITSIVMGDSPNKVVLTTSGTNGYQLTVNNVQDLFSNTLVSPTQVIIGWYPNLALWLRADAGVIPDGTGAVTEWDDQSGNGNNVFGVGAPYNPQLTNGLNGNPAVYFNGTNYLYTSSTPTLAIAGDIGIEAALSFNTPDYPATGGFSIVSKTAGTANNIPASYDLYSAPVDGRMHFYRGNGGAGGNLVSYGSDFSTVGPSLNTPHIVTATMAGTTASQFLDGVANGSGQIAVPLVDQGGVFGVGGRADFFNADFTPNAASPKMVGPISEILLFSVGLSAADRAQFDQYLSTKYAIAITPPASPKLTITQSGTNSFLISWATPVFTYTLQQSPSLSSPAWINVTNTVSNSVTAAGNTSSVTVTSAGTSQFYRLQKQ